MQFLDALRSHRVLLMDGAMGTELQRAGVQGSYELWNVTHPDRVRAIHQFYLDAGAEVLLTNTFQARDPKLIRAGIDLARSVAGPARFVLVSIGPMDAPVEPTFSGADGLLLETFSGLDAFDLARRFSETGLPVLLSFTFLHTADGLRTFEGQAPEFLAEHARDAGISALGVNCGRDIDMTDVIEIVRRYRTVTDLPLFARPNAGTPQGGTYPRSPEMMAARLPDLLDAGATMVGGCCGTTPAHIAAFRDVIQRVRRSP